MPIFHLDHRLADFDKWLGVFRDGSLRKEREAEFGVATRRVVRDANDPNHVIVIMEAPSRDAIDNMANHPQVQERFADTSIFTEPPKVIAGYEGTDIGTMSEGDVSAFFLDQQLVDYDKWSEMRSGNEAERNEVMQKHGVNPVRLLHDIDNRNHVVVVMQAPNRAAMENMLAEPTAQANFANKEVFARTPEITGQFSGVDV
ncbi:MAG: DUF4412 domain-containing protein [Gemmatimonadetes bacterium]|jgi:hypothetical protein|nr:DUF4412 domain-containing protein [Gemmatimonadota bacterium]